MDDLAAFGIDAEGVLFVALFRGSRQPDAAFQFDRGRPAFVVKGSFPFDVLVFTPLQREIRRGGVRVSRGTLELIPVFRGDGRCDNQT